MEPELYRIANSMFVDFNLIASRHPKLYNYLVILDYKTTINFKNQQSLIVLTEAIMKSIFNIQFHCPYNNLCPRIPNRLNYLMWISKFGPLQIKYVLDVGTGATLIYPLLGWATFGWNFIATQSNPQSVINARRLIQVNKLTHQIQVIQVSRQNDILQFCQQKLTAVVCLDHTIDVMICNPPFFEQQQDFNPSQQVMHVPLGVMLNQEFSCAGGEYSFFFQLYRQSFKHVSTPVGADTISKGMKIKYFTCLLGRLSSFKQVTAFLKAEDQLGMLECYKLGQIKQGQNLRFVVLWKPKTIILNSQIN